MQNFIRIYQQIWILQLFPISLDFCTLFLLFSVQKSNFGPIQLDIIANIVSKVINYDYAKFNAFIKKLTIDVIFRWIECMSSVVS